MSNRGMVEARRRRGRRSQHTHASAAIVGPLCGQPGSLCACVSHRPAAQKKKRLSGAGNEPHTHNNCHLPVELHGVTNNLQVQFNATE